MSEELKTCPFCGGKAKFRPITNSIHGANRGFLFRIECSRCGVTLPKQYALEYVFTELGGLKAVVDEREMAIKSWNRRVNNEIESGNIQMDNSKKLLKEEYNKAVDDTIKAIREEYAFTILEEEKIDEIAQQLKGAKQNEDFKQEEIIKAGEIGE